MSVELPERIGRYRVEAVIGTGGFATVYRAHDERLEAKVAVKVLAENHCLDPDVRERFLTEGRVLRRIGSPHVVTVHDLGETSRGQPYLVLDHADRGDLAARVHQRRAAGWRPDVDDLVTVAEAVADALVAVHAVGLVHRDVAPRNLLLRSVRAVGPDRGGSLVAADEQLVLADLGLSKDLALTSGITVGGGTAGFTPPEQRAGAGRVGPSADVWAASALVVWLLTDAPPDDTGAWRRQVEAAGWPRDLVDALDRGLQHDPAGRYADASAWFAGVRAAVVPTVRRAGPAGVPPSVLPSADATVAAPVGPVGGAARSGSRTALVILVSLLAGVLLAVGASFAYDSVGDGTSETTQELGEGRVRATTASGDAEVAITGPTAVGVGETATFTADARGVTRTVWIAPDGELHVDRTTLSVRTGSAGTATATLVGVLPDGRHIEAHLTFEVRAP